MGDLQEWQKQLIDMADASFRTMEEQRRARAKADLIGAVITTVCLMIWYSVFLLWSR